MMDEDGDRAIEILIWAVVICWLIYCLGLIVGWWDLAWVVGFSMGTRLVSGSVFISGGGLFVYFNGIQLGWWGWVG